MLDYCTAAVKRLDACRQLNAVKAEYYAKRNEYNQAVLKFQNQEVDSASPSQVASDADAELAKDGPSRALEPPPGPPPSAPDFEALIAALPPVPEPPGLDAPEILPMLYKQACDSCGAPYLPPAPASSRITWGTGRAVGASSSEQGSTAQEAVIAALKPRLELLYATLSYDVDTEEGERGEAGGTSGGGAGGVDSIADANKAVSEYLHDLGIDAAFLEQVLVSTPCCTAEGVPCKAGSSAGTAAGGAAGGTAKRKASSAVEEEGEGGGGGGEQRLVAMRQDARELAPLTKTLDGGWGGFTPLTGYVYDPAMLLHEEPQRPWSKKVAPLQLHGAPQPAMPIPPHPERPDRLRAIAQHLVAHGLLQRCLRIRCRPVLDEEVSRVHEAQHVQAIHELPGKIEEGGGAYVFDGGDTFANEHTYNAALLAAGSLVELTEAVCRGTIDRGVALIRPPGHHAEPDRAMGFCLFNNVAVAAAAARKRFGCRRVLILDWDVHHGNGTERQFYEDPSVLFISLHRYDHGNFYPGTGHIENVGRGAGEGYNINIAWNGGGTGDAEYMMAFDDVIMPVATAFAPDLVLVSAGFDAARGDPLGGNDVTPAGYAHMTHRLLSLAQGRLVVALEGGYNLTSISRSMEAVVRVLMGASPPPLLDVPKHIHAPSEGSSVGGGSGSAGYITPASLPGFTTPLDPLDAQEWAQEDEQLQEMFEGDSRSTVLQRLAPRARALSSIARVLHTLSPYWPVLKGKYSAYSQHIVARMQEEAAKVQAAAAASAAGDGVGGDGAVRSTSLAPASFLSAFLAKGKGKGPLHKGEGEEHEGEGDEEGDDGDDEDDMDEDDDEEDGEEDGYEDEEGGGEGGGYEDDDEASKEEEGQGAPTHKRAKYEEAKEES